MSKKKKAITLPKNSVFMRHMLLRKECAKLDPKAERAMAEEGLSEDFNNWPKY
ncbi:MAG: hypothetical protein ACLPVI_08700 [Dehalococcoidales bacterium]